MSNTPHPYPSPCPVTELIAHSEQHFASDDFQSLCERRARNLEFVSERLLVRLADLAPSAEDHNRVARAAISVRAAIHSLRGGEHNGVQLSQEEKAQGS